jgi:hypothetical protein
LPQTLGSLGILLVSGQLSDKSDSFGRNLAGKLSRKPLVITLPPKYDNGRLIEGVATEVLEDES